MNTKAKQVIFSRTGAGMLKMAYDKIKVRRRKNKTIVKNTKATVYTNPTTQTLSGQGTKTRTVIRPTGTTTKVKPLNYNKLAKLI